MINIQTHDIPQMAALIAGAVTDMLASDQVMIDDEGYVNGWQDTAEDDIASTVCAVLVGPVAGPVAGEPDDSKLKKEKVNERPTYSITV